MLVIGNAGHCPGIDPGCQGSKVDECDLAKIYTEKINAYLEAAGVRTRFIQDDDLGLICRVANESKADLFYALHFNAFTNPAANGTEVLYHSASEKGKVLAQCVLDQLTTTLGLTNRGIKTGDTLYVLKHTDMPANLIEVGFLSNEKDQDVCINQTDSACAAIARGITDYICAVNSVEAKGDASNMEETYESKYFGEAELQCHCGCGTRVSSPVLLQFLDELREKVGGPVQISCQYRCPTHNAEVGGVPNSQHVEGTAADVIVPDGMTVDELAELAIGLNADGVGRYYDSGFVHCDVRDGRTGAGYAWTDRD